VAPDEMARAFELRDDLGRGLRACGYAFVALDLFGYRTGSLNALLQEVRR
jgi:uncharacterized protein